jgi:hypothetical protein
MRTAARLVVIALVGAGLSTVGASPVTAGPINAAPQHEAVAGFATVSDDGFSVVFADGSVRPRPFGDAFSLRLGTGVVGGAGTPTGDGSWELAADGNVFSFGAAGAYGGAGGGALNAAAVGMASTRTGKGYWLTARDGGVFAFGDAAFRGSAAKKPLHQPIVGISASPIGGYRLVARDGGVFGFGKATFLGSLPKGHVHSLDVVGMATTPTGKGYWLARSDGRVYPFGDAQRFGGVRPSACDRIAAIIGNPVAPGYRLVTESGRTYARGAAPGGTEPTGFRRSCGNATSRIELPHTTMVTGTSLIGHLVIDNQTGAPLHLHESLGCKPRWLIDFGNHDIPNRVVWPQAEKCRRPASLVIPEGQHQYGFTIRARYIGTGNALPIGRYFASFSRSGGRFPPVARVAVDVVAPT